MIQESQNPLETNKYSNKNITGHTAKRYNVCCTYFELFAPAFPAGGFPPKNGLSPADLKFKIIKT